MKIKKRFIAGATCPQCQQSDSLRWWEESQVEWVECVECGFEKQRTSNAVETSSHGQEKMIGIFQPE